MFSKLSSDESTTSKLNLKLWFYSIMFIHHSKIYQQTFIFQAQTYPGEAESKDSRSFPAGFYLFKTHLFHYLTKCFQFAG